MDQNNTMDRKLIAPDATGTVNGHRSAIAPPDVVGEPTRRTTPAQATRPDRQRPPWPLFVLAPVIILGVLGWTGSELWRALVRKYSSRPIHSQAALLVVW